MFRLAILGGFAVAAAWFALSAVPAIGGSSATISATVTPTAACVTVSQSTLDFGTGSFSKSNFDSTLGGSAFSFTNCSQQDADIFVSGTDATSATSSAKWTLHGADGQCGAGLNQYALQIWGTFLTTSNQLLGHFGGGNTAAGVVPNLHMPCTGSDGAGEKMNFQINFTASL